MRCFAVIFAAMTMMLTACVPAELPVVEVNLEFEEISIAALLDNPTGDCLVVADIFRGGHPEVLWGSLNEGMKLLGWEEDAALSEPWIRDLNIDGYGCLVADVTRDRLVDLIIPGQRPPQIHLQLPNRWFYQSELLLRRIDFENHVAQRGAAIADLDGDGSNELIFGAGALQNDVRCEQNGSDVQCFAENNNGERIDPLPSRNKVLSLRRSIVYRDATAEFRPPLKPGLTLGLDTVFQPGSTEIGLLEVNDFDGNRLLVSNEHGRLRDVATDKGLGARNHGMGSAQGDFNGDGLSDIFITDMGASAYFEAQQDGMYLDRAVDSGIAALTKDHISWGTEAWDMDNDGDLDILVGSSFTSLPDQVGEAASESARRDSTPDVRTFAADEQMDLVLVNNGEGVFGALPAVRPFPKTLRGIMFRQSLIQAADLDNDGLSDLIIADPYNGLRIYKNTTPPEFVGNWLKVRLRGPWSNSQGIGSRIYIRPIGGSLDGVEQFRDIRGNSAGGHGPRFAHFGLGDATAAEVWVIWQDQSMSEVVEHKAGIDVVVNFSQDWSW